MKIKSKTKPINFNVEEIIFLFNCLLSDEYQLYTRLLKAGENMEGHNFSGLLHAFQGKTLTMFSILTEVSHQAFALANFAFGYREDFMKITVFKETINNTTDHKKKIQILLTSYGDIINMLRKNMISVTERYTAPDTSGFVLDLIDKHEKMAELFKKVYPNMVLAQ